MNLTVVTEFAEELLVLLSPIIYNVFSSSKEALTTVTSQIISTVDVAWYWALNKGHGVLASSAVVTAWGWVMSAYALVLPYWDTVLTSEFSVSLILFTLVFYSLSGFNSRNKEKKREEMPTTLSIFDLAKTANVPRHCEQVIELLEQFKYDVNFQVPTTGLNLFLCACISGDRKLVKFMLNQEADVTRHTREGDGALYLATFGLLSSDKARPDLSVLDDLISAGCDVNARNTTGYTALHQAASKGSVPFVTFLLRHGADPKLSNSSGMYPMDSAGRMGHIHVAELLKVHRPYREHVAEPYPISSPHPHKLLLLDKMGRHEGEEDREVGREEEGGSRTPPHPHFVVESPLIRRSQPHLDGLHWTRDV